MPLFEYECTDCKTRFEQLVLSESPGVVCRGCGSANVSQLLSTFSVGNGTDRSSVEANPCSTCGAAERGMCGLN